MLKVELKRTLKTRSTWWLIGIALVMCVYFAYQAINFEAYYDEDEHGQLQIVTGAEAYELNKERYSLIEGEVTPELIANAMKVYHELIAQYGNEASVPSQIDSAILGPYSHVYTWVGRAFIGGGSAYSAALSDITPEQSLNYYNERLAMLERALEQRYEKQPQVVSYAMSRVDSDERFNFSYDLGSTQTFQQLGMCIFLVALICSVINAPVFSSDYSNGADDILRCTRHGRKRLASAKLRSAMIVSLGIFILCIGVFLIIIYSAFGFNDSTSAQLLNMAWTPGPLTAMGLFGLMLLLCLLSFLATTCFTLFLSSRFNSMVAVLSISIAVVLIPIALLLTKADGNLLNWIKSCLPSGSLFPSSILLNEIIDLKFLWIGDFVTWPPYVMLIASAVQVPIWLALAVRSYNKHEAA